MCAAFRQFVTPKSLFASKTFWVDALTTGVAVLTLIAGQEWIAEYPKVTAGIVGTIAVLKIVLRYVTVSPIE